MRYFKATVITMSTILLIVIVVRHKFGRPMRYEFVGGFSRWVVVQFQDPSCPPLRSDGLFLVVSVPTSGKVCTSTARPQGWIYYRFAYIYPNGQREALPMRTGSDPSGRVQVYLLTYQPQ